jgi:crotonobetainyl-CoA:carnitine CoA-transferase CaiB-like acyl-CoA transferase
MKTPEGQTRCGELLAGADLLITSNRPSVLARLHIAWETLHPRFPNLCQVAIFGYPEPRSDVAGHDLTYLGGPWALIPAKPAPHASGRYGGRGAGGFQRAWAFVWA